MIAPSTKPRTWHTEATSTSVIRHSAMLLHRRLTVVTLTTVILLVAVATITMMTGRYPLAPADILAVLTGGGNQLDSYILFGVRLPRLAITMLAGVAFGLSGALLQSLLGNPLASPDLLGISGGAAVAAIIVTLGVGATGLAVTAAALMGATVVAVLILAAARHGQGTGHRLVLTGVGFAFLASAIIGFMIKRAQINEAQSALFWTVGSVANSTWTSVIIVALTVAIALPGVVYASRVLPILQLGSATANGLGLADARARRVVVATAVILAAGAVSVVGPISFVALCAPAIARRTVGRGSNALTVSALGGALMLVVSDAAAQHLFAGAVPTGVITGVIGAPYLLWLLATPTKGTAL